MAFGKYRSRVLWNYFPLLPRSIKQFEQFEEATQNSGRHNAARIRSPGPSRAFFLTKSTRGIRFLRSPARPPSPAPGPPASQQPCPPRCSQPWQSTGGPRCPPARPPRLPV